MRNKIKIRGILFDKDGRATTKPITIANIIETTEMKIVVLKPLNKNFKLVSPSILLGDKINQLSSLLPHDVKGKIKSKKNKFLTLKVIKN